MGRTPDESERGRAATPPSHVVAGDRDDWMLAVEVREFGDHYRIRAELPGVAAADIDVAVEDGMLLLSGRRPRLWHDPGNPHRGACRYRRFARSISLPFDARPERFTVTRDEGVVDVRFAKRYAPEASRAKSE